MQSLNQQKNILLSVSVVMLFLALLDGWQYGYFTLLRFVVCATTAYVAYQAFMAEVNPFWGWSLGAVAVLFNPFIPIYLSRDVWVIIDFVVALFLIAVISILKFKE